MKNDKPIARVRLYSHVTKTRFLHVEDALNIGKVRLFAGTYRRGAGMTSQTNHFIDLADARVLFLALLNGEQSLSYKEYKGTPPQSGKQVATSRVLSVTIKGENAYIELKCGPGRMTATGAITPNGRAEVEVNVTFKSHEVRRLAGEVLAYIHAWDVCRMMTFRQMVGSPMPYLLSTAEVKEPDVTPSLTGNGDSDVVIEEPKLPPQPVTRKDVPMGKRVGVTQPNGQQRNGHSPTVASQVAVVANRLRGGTRYTNGVALNVENVAEVQAFRQYVMQYGRPPKTKAVLQSYYRQHLMT